jgi:phosphomannomutase
MEFVSYSDIGNYTENHHLLNYHIRKILDIPFVDKEAISTAGFRVAYDAVNSVGGIALPELFTALGVLDVIPLNNVPDGNFAHNPEPLPEHLEDICRLVRENKADVGFVVDPDVDRLAIVMENGKLFGEEYTLVAVADYILSYGTGNTVSNLSSTRALMDVTLKHGGRYFASAVGEVNVVQMMKEQHAVIGGEGNGGVIYPALHYGRDALAGIALFLSHLAKSRVKCSELRMKYPDYFMSKNKVTLKQGTTADFLIGKVKEAFREYPVNDSDGLKIDFPDGWVHLRQSNTEPIMRIYAEGKSRKLADELAATIVSKISSWTC